MRHIKLFLILFMGLFLISSVSALTLYESYTPDYRNEECILTSALSHCYQTFTVGHNRHDVDRFVVMLNRDGDWDGTFSYWVTPTDTNGYPLRDQALCSGTISGNDVYLNSEPIILSCSGTHFLYPYTTYAIVLRGTYQAYGSPKIRWMGFDGNDYSGGSAFHSVTPIKDPTDDMWFRIYGDPVLNGCYCPGKQDWLINMGEYCGISSNCNLGPGRMIFTGGAGQCIINSNVWMSNLDMPGSGQTLYLGSSARLWLSG